ncbi:MAG: DUF4215 domain-containing protein [Candidatus Binatia bacterium]
MRNRWHILAVALQLALVLGLHVGRAGALTTETYLFRDSFAPIEGAGNVLVPVSNKTATIVTSGPNFVNGTFVTESISASACASTPTVRAWSFPISGGLRHANATPSVVTGSYSISMLLRYNPMDTGYARLIDFSNSTQDTGIYKLGNGVSFYPVGTYAAGSFVQNQDVFVTITRNAGTKLVSLYINGTPSGTYTDTGNLYAPSATAVYFLMDNTTGSAAISETDPGVIAYLQVRDTVMTTQEVADSLATICDAVSCGDGLVAGTEACDDGNATSGDGCSASCAVEECWQCSGTPSVCAPLDAGTACTDDGDSCTDDVCDGAGICGVPVCGTTTSTTTITTTTTTQPTGCGGTPAAATFDSVACRVDALLARVRAEPGLGSFQSKLAKNLEQAKSLTAKARGLGSSKKARTLLKQAAKALSQYVHRLGTQAARRKIPDTLRTEFQKAGANIAPDVQTLRSQV